MHIWLNTKSNIPSAKWVQENGEALPTRPTWPGQDADWYPCALIEAYDYRPVLICWFKKEVEYVGSNYRITYIKWFKVKKDKLREVLDEDVWNKMRFHLEEDSFHYGD